MAHALYSSYAHVFYEQKASLGDLGAMLHVVDGFAPRLRDACQKASVTLQFLSCTARRLYSLNYAESRERDLDVQPDDLQALRLERDTWDLLQHIYGYVASCFGFTISSRILQSP